MSEHVSAEKLAQLSEGELRPAAARRIQAHLSGCAACRAESDALAALPALLASARPPAMPAHLAARIETALAAESAQRAAETARQAAPAPQARQARRPRFWPSRLGTPPPGPARRILAAAAAVVVLGGGGYAVFASLGRSVQEPTSAAAAAPAASLPSAAPSTVPRPSNQGLAGGIVHPGALGRVTFGPAVSYHSGSHIGQFMPVQTDTDFQPGTLGRQAASALATADGNPAAGGASTQRPGPDLPQAPTTSSFGGRPLLELAGCVARVAGSARVLLVDVAVYRGQAATIIVTAGSPDEAWVVGPGCSASVSDVLARQALPS